MARAVGDALVDLHGESLLRDAVGAVERCGDEHGEQCRALVQAHLDYGQARAAIAKRDVVKGASLMERATDGFRRGGSPMMYVAAYFAAGANNDAGNIDAASAALTIAGTDRTASHRAQHAQILWAGGLIAGIKGQYYEAVAAFREAHGIFVQIEERENSLKTLALQADVLARMGQTADAYRVRGEAIALAADSGIQNAVVGTLHTAVLGELFEQRWPEAISLLNVLLATRGITPRFTADSHVRRAYAEAQLGETQRAEADLRKARKAAAALSDPALIALTLDDVNVINGLLAQSTNPRLASDIFSQSITFAEQHNRGFRLPELHHERARCAVAEGDGERAIKDFNESLALIENRRKEIAADELRDSFSGTHDRLFDDYLALLASRQDYDHLFAVAEQARARLILDRLSPSAASEPLSPAAVAHDIGRDTVIVEYVTLPQSLIILVLDAKGLRAREVEVTSETITGFVEQFRRAILNGAGDEPARFGRALHRLLLEPVEADIGGAKFLVISPDSRLAAVPFAALSDSQGHLACENHAIVIAASSSVYTQSLQRSHSTASDRALIVGDPAFDTRLFPQLADLPAAEAEARRIAALYPRATLWTGAEATAEQVKTTLESAGFVHLATHALVNERDPSRSSLVLAPSSGNSGLLYVYEIMNLKLHASLVTLTGCRTAANGEAHGSVRSLALAFVAAGARNVLGTLWNVDDEAARNASITFHRALRTGVSPAEALQQTQVALLRSPDPKQRAYKNWAAFQIHGTGF